MTNNMSQHVKVKFQRSELTVDFFVFCKVLQFGSCCLGNITIQVFRAAMLASLLKTKLMSIFLYTVDRCC